VRLIGEVVYLIAGFRGWPATLLKFFFLGIVDLIGGIALSAAIAGHSTMVIAAIAAILLLVNYVYIFRAPTPLKFLTPGIVFLATFVLVPIIYTVGMSGFKYNTGNVISKAEAIPQLLNNSLSESPDGTAYDMTLGKDANGKYAALLHDQVTGVVSYVDMSGLKVLAAGDYTVDENGLPTGTAGFTAMSLDQVDALGDKLTDLRFPAGGRAFISPLYAGVGILLTQDLTYDSKTDTFTSASTGKTYKDGGQGNYVNSADSSEVLFPGWRAVNFPENFTALLSDAEVRGPFIRVFIWTIAFAFLSVFTTFVVGLTLALAMDKKFRGRRIYRSILILPYAIPGFLSILIWRGMFNKDFGIINRLLQQYHLIHHHIAWFDSPWTARGVVLFVNLWLGFPYMYLISSGALQAIPAELKEAAAIDGASAWQAFRQVVLPLLLQILFPLLISSFAFNFNNFNIIYLLTGGGPRDELAGERAGATDILISYAYETAISNPMNQNFGLASAISLFMFIIVGVLSMWSLRLSKALEEF